MTAGAAAKPLERTRRYASLDHWRGVACLLVLVNHSVFFHSVTGMLTVNAMIAAASRRMWAGVPIFFVISGYCITATIDTHRRRRVDARTYFLRRFRRIFPPYWAVVFGAAVLIGIMDVALGGAISADARIFRPWWFSGWQWFGSLTLTETWRSHLIGGPKGLFLGPAWTLCYEEQFYAVSGVLLLLAPKRFFAGAVVVTALVLPLAAITKYQPFIEGFFFDGGWLQFALGIFLYYALVEGGWLARTIAGSTFLLVVLLAALRGSALLAPDKNDAQAFFVAGSFAFLALILHRFDKSIVQARILEPFQVCGRMCYSLYLVHLPIVAVILGMLRATRVDADSVSPFVSIPLCAIPALAIAWQFHVSVERRFMTSASSPTLQPGPLAVAV